MTKEQQLWHFVGQCLLDGQKVALLLVLESSGSSPGRAGFKLALSQSGDMCGSIGGGIMEVKLTELAKSFLKKGDFSVVVKKQIHNKKAGKNQSGMICSGEQTIAICCIDQTYFHTINKIIGALSEKKSFALIAKTANQLFVLDMAADANPSSNAVELKMSGENDFYYKEYIGAVNTLYIIGGGHCALALSEVMAKIGFYVVVIDDRPYVNTLRVNVFADEIQVVEDYAHIRPLIKPGPHVYIAIMTLGYATDLIALRQIALQPCHYIGLLGSKAKVAEILANLQSEGFPEWSIRRIHAPIGLQIHSHTPEEIAVSIAAEIIAQKNNPT